MNINELMTAEVVTVSPETPLKDVATLLVSNRISGVPVCDDERRVLGVLSEADILWKEVGNHDEPHGLVGRALELAYGDGQRSAALTAAESMSTPPIVVSPTTPVSAAARLMIEHAVNRLPVVEDGKLVGIVTRADLVRAFARPDAEIEREIRDDVLLHTLWVDPDRVSVEVVVGAVTLSGEVENRTTAELVERYVARVPGVVGVHSNLRWQVDDRRRSRPATTTYRDGLTTY